ncbi:hypothetical protein BRARA_D02557 [Brassica rapa]|uniref:WRC domain-containing protein n=2 Tax=Brassica campestris TaxID=3711 RepID=A0A397ZPD3_BRACM|nr:hypothetical protein IGI04_016989 [Brassica rapa subsp. trilocularis]RID67477.1 hypothetical protein BRARA_D02557 [Brassica rapa]
MRIRKRQVPLPLSSLLPVPLSDLCSNRSPTSAARYFHGQDIDGGSSASLLHLPLIQRDVTSKKEEKALDDDYGDGDDVDVKSCTVASGSNNVNSQGESDSSTQAVEKNQNVVTLRKRRSYTSFEEQEEEEDEEEEEEANKGKKKRKGKKKSSDVLEEGSRCSRVNGRGWRCCQQTLYGYSLCEHHLGKGRVRSTNKSSGGRGGGQKKSVVAVEVKKKKKRVKLGMVKARSINSLLGQTSTSSGVSEISAPADQFAANDK